MSEHGAVYSRNGTDFPFPSTGATLTEEVTLILSLSSCTRTRQALGGDGSDNYKKEKSYRMGGEAEGKSLRGHK